MGFHIFQSNYYLLITSFDLYLNFLIYLKNIYIFASYQVTLKKFNQLQEGYPLLLIKRMIYIMNVIKF